jgi:hypothetical protein
MTIQLTIRGVGLGFFTLLSSRLIFAQPASPTNQPTSDFRYQVERNQRFIELVQSQGPLSWVAPLGELSPTHRLAAPAPVGIDRKPTYIFSAQLTTQFVVLAPLRGRVMLTIDPTFNLRMLNVESKPVRTPSYHIGGFLYYRLGGRSLRLLSSFQPDSAGNNELQFQPYFSNFRLGYFHYSNGQEAPALINNYANEVNGDFSTNAIFLGPTFGYATPRLYQGYSVLLKVGLPKLSDEYLQGRYLNTRLEGRAVWKISPSIAFIRKRIVKLRSNNKIGQGISGKKDSLTYTRLALRRKERWHLEASTSFGFGSLSEFKTPEPTFSRRTNAEITAVFIPRFAIQTGGFITLGYYGQDPYNIWFHRSYPFLRFGIATAAFKSKFTY